MSNFQYSFHWRRDASCISNYRKKAFDKTAKKMQFFSMVGGRFIDPLLYEDPPSLFRILSNSLSPPTSSYCLISSAECVIIPQLMLFSFALWLNIRHRTDKHTGYSDRYKTQWPIDWHTRIKTYQHHLLFAHRCYLNYTEWITCWYKNSLYRGPKCRCFSKITLGRGHIFAD